MNMPRELELLEYAEKLNAKEADKKALIKHILSKHCDEAAQKAVYEKNIELLRDYPYISRELPEYEDLDYRILSCDNETVVYLKLSSGELCVEKYAPYRDIDCRKLYMCANEANICSIIELGEKNEDYNSRLYPDIYKKRPFYLYYDSYDYCCIFTVVDISPLLENERVLFFFSKEELTVFFTDPYCAFPNEIPDSIKELMGDLRAERNSKINALIEKAKAYYRENRSGLIERIKSGKPRILLISTRFGYAVKNQIADLNSACVRLGYETRVLVQQPGVRFNHMIYEALYEFKPDIVIAPNAFRSGQFAGVPNEIPFITWFLDETPFCELGENDYLFNTYISTKKIYGYDASKIDKSKVFKFPLCANPDIYRPVTLTPDETAKYDCDVCIVVGNGAYETHLHTMLDDFLKKFSEQNGFIFKKETSKKIHACLDEMCVYIREMLETEVYRYSDETNSGELRRLFEKTLSPDEYSEALIVFLTEKFIAIRLPEAIYRHVLMDWILEIEEINLKIWGGGWDTIPKYKKYAMGLAKGGEQLCKAYAGAKISIGSNPFASAAGKLFEATLSGCLFIANTIPDGYDSINAYDLFDNDEMLFFENKKDLQAKIRYYMSHEEERRALNEKGRRRILRDIVYDKRIESAILSISQKNR